MPDINKPMSIPGLNLRPPIEGKVRLSTDMQQTLALLAAYGINKRIVLRGSELGVLNVTSARIKNIVHYTRSGVTEEIQGDNVTCSEVIVIGHPDNTGKIWVRTDVVATVDNAVPLDAKDRVGFSINNLAELQLFVAVDEETAIVMYA